MLESKHSLMRRFTWRVPEQLGGAGAFLPPARGILLELPGRSNNIIDRLIRDCTSTVFMSVLLSWGLLREVVEIKIK